MQSGFGVKFLFWSGMIGKLPANFSANFDGEMFWRLFRPWFSRISGAPKPKIHPQKLSAFPDNPYPVN